MLNCNEKKCFKKFSLFLIIIFSLSLIFTAGTISAETPDELSKNASKELREAEKCMFSGKNDDAMKCIGKAEEIIKSLKSADPNHKDLPSLEKKSEKIKGDIERKTTKKSSLGKIGDTIKSEVKTNVNEATEKVTGKSENKLPSQVTFRLKEIDRILGKSDRVMRDDYPGGKDAQSKALDEIVKEANGKMDEIEKNYGDQISPDNKEIAETKAKIAAVEEKSKNLSQESGKEKAETEKKAGETKASSDEWIKKFKPYVEGMGSPEYNKEKYFIAGYTEEKEEMEKRLKLYAELKNLYEEYKKNEPGSKTDELEQVIKKVDYSIKSFEQEKDSMFKFNIKKIKQQITEKEDFIKAQETSANPIPMDNYEIITLKKRIDNAALSAPKDDQEIVSINQSLDNIIKKNAEIKKKMIASITIKPEKYKGSESAEIKSKAEAVVKEKISGINIVRNNIISSDWAEESVIEYTDTTRTALQHRVTRSITVQIAGKTSAGCFLYTLDISKDKRTDGSWDELKGHIMFTDEMLEENIKK